PSEHPPAREDDATKTGRDHAGPDAGLAPPTLAFDPIAGATDPSLPRCVKSAAVEVTGRVRAAAGATPHLAVDGIDAAKGAVPDDGSFTAALTLLHEGATTFRFTATDEGGRTKREELVLELDTQPPSLRVERPAPTDPKVDASELEVSGTVEDAHPRVVRV